jgi:hypothetical protein
MDGRTFVCVDWYDAYSYNEQWVDYEETDLGAVINRSVGILIPNAKDGYVVIAQTDNQEDAYDGLLFIPVGMVANLRVVSDLRSVPFSATSD